MSSEGAMDRAPPAVRLRPGTPGDGSALREARRSAILAQGGRGYPGEELGSWAAGLAPEGCARAVGGRGEVFEVAAGDRGGLVGCSSRRADEALGPCVHPGHAGRGFYERRGHRCLGGERKTIRGGPVVEAIRVEEAL